jgi:DNA gyrase subunit B
MGNPAESQARRFVIARRLDTISEETERGWEGVADRRWRTDLYPNELRGVKEAVCSMPGSSAHPKRCGSIVLPVTCRKPTPRPPSCAARRPRSPIYSPMDLINAIFAQGRKGMTMQRYKGLGEMNPEQLWETTLDPHARSLLQVRVNDAVDADSLFSRLMGDEVEPRREFIQDNALSVANLDI